MKIVSFVSFVFVLIITSQVEADLPSKELEAAQIHVESGGDDNAVGDLNLSDHAYGCLQIRQPSVDDYNRWHKTSFRAEECKNNRELSLKIYRDYIDHYATSHRLGHVPTDEDKARIWNGGPNGYKRSSTVSYWQKVKTALGK